MKSLYLRFSLSIPVVFLLILGLILLSSPIQAATDARLYLSPSSSNLEKDKKVTYSVKLDTASDSVDSVQAELSFDNAKLSFVSVDVNTSKFPFIVEESHSGGKVTVVAGSAAQVSGNVTVATLVLKAKTGSGSTSVSFNESNSYAVKGGVNRLGSSSSASITFKSPPAPTPDPKPDPTPAPTPDPKPDSDSSNNQDSNLSNQSSSDGKPALSNQGFSSVGFNTANAFLSTNEPTQAALLIGLSENDLKVAVQSKGFSNSHDFSLGKNYLAPGNTFYYRFVITDKDGNKTKSNIQTISTKGYPVTVQLTDINNEPVSNWDVSLFSDPQTAKTNSEGKATFENTPAGTHTIQVQVRGDTYTQEIKIKDTLNSTKNKIDANASPAAQAFSFAVTQDFPTELSVVRTMTYLLAVLVGFIVFIFIARRIFLVARSLGTKGVVVSDMPQPNAQPQPGPYPPAGQAPTQGSAGSVYLPTNDPNQTPPQSPTQSNQDGHKRL